MPSLPTTAFAALSLALLTLGFATDQWWPLAGGTWAAAVVAWRVTPD
jgi:hypothetical protein